MGYFESTDTNLDEFSGGSENSSEGSDVAESSDLGVNQPKNIEN